MDAMWIDKNDSEQMKKILWFRIRYYQTKLDDAIKEFEQAKRELRRRIDLSAQHGYAPPAKTEIKQLRRLRHVVKQFEKKLESLFEELNPPPVEITYTEEQLKTMSENRNEAASMLSELTKMEV